MSTPHAPVNVPESLSIATLVIYVVLLQPVTYVFYKHGLRNWLAWLPLQSLCILRIVGSALQIQADTSKKASSAALIVSNIGLAPLLLGGLGVLHEAREAPNLKWRKVFQWILVIQIHMIVTVGVVLVVIGAVNLMGTHPKTSDETLEKIGVLIMMACWVVLVGWVLSAFRSGDYDVAASRYEPGTILLYGAAAALPFIGVREIDAVLNYFVTSEGFQKSVAAKVVLNLLPEVLAVIALTRAGLKSRDIRRGFKSERSFSATEA